MAISAGRRQRRLLLVLVLIVQIPLALLSTRVGGLNGVLGHVPVCHDAPWELPATIGLQLADCPDEQPPPPPRQVPGGGLPAHEPPPNGIGPGLGHTIEKHVAKTLDYLRHRLATEPIPAAGTYTTLEAADDIAAQVIELNATRIQAWLTGTTRATEAFTASFGWTTGYSLLRGASDWTAVQTARVVLSRSDVFDFGYYILTSYPEL